MSHDIFDSRHQRTVTTSAATAQLSFTPKIQSPPETVLWVATRQAPVLTRGASQVLFRVFLLLYNPQLSSNITHSLNLNQVNEQTCEAQWTYKKKGVHSHYKKRVLMHRARCQLQSSVESRLSLLSFLLVPFRVVPEAHTERRALREAFSSANQDHCSQTERPLPPDNHAYYLLLAGKVPCFCFGTGHLLAWVIVGFGSLTTRLGLSGNDDDVAVIIIIGLEFVSP